MNDNKIKNKIGTTDCCPLSGAAKAISMIEGSIMVIIGTEECIYYTQTMLRKKDMDKNCFGYILKNEDITFGCVDKVYTYCSNLLTQHSPGSLYIVTTCVAEITGDDFGVLVEKLKETYKIPVSLIRTCHYKGNNEEYGFELVRKVSQSDILKISNMFIRRLKAKFSMKRSDTANNSKEGISPSYRMGIMWTLLTIPDTVVLEFGTMGTTAYAKRILESKGIDTTNKLFSTGLSETEVVMGGTKRLEESLREIDNEYSPKGIFVMSSSVSEVIGYDVKGICNYMQKELKAKVVPVTETSFKTKLYEDGVTKALAYKNLYNSI